MLELVSRLGFHIITRIIEIEGKDEFMCNSSLEAI